MANIDEVINDARLYSQELLDDARELVNDANQIAAGRSFVNVRDVTWELQGTDPEDVINDVDVPDDFSDAFTLPEFTGEEEIEFRESYIPTVPSMPEAPEELDTSRLFNISRPNWDVPDFTKPSPNVNTNLEIPDAPDLSLPEAPDGAGSAIDVPEFSPPTFDETMDLPDVQELDVTGRVADEFDIKRVELVQAADSYADAWLSQHCPEYDSGMAELESRISTAMQGGSAMDEAWEKAIYDRAVVRVNDAEHVAQESITKDYGRRGFSIPPGAVMSALSRIRHESGRNLADVSGQVAVERARLELQHLQLGMQLSAQLRQHFSSAMQNYMQLVYAANGQALQYAAEIGRWAAEIFNQRLKIHEIERARYLAEAQVYSVRLESSFALIRQFEVQIEAEKLKIDTDRNEIALYEAKIRGEQSKVDIYNSQLQGIRTLLEAEAQKISVFESEVRAYAQRISGKESEYNAYRAAIQGDAEKVQGYRAEVQAYSSQVDAAGTLVSAERAISQSIEEHNAALINQRDSTIRKYIAEIQAESSRHDSAVDVQRLALAKYTAELEARLRMVTTRYEADRLELRADLARVETNLAAQTTNVDGYIQSIAAQARITNAGAGIIGDMASSSLTTNNAILTQEE